METLKNLMETFNITSEQLEAWKTSQKILLRKLQEKEQALQKRLQKEEEKQWLVTSVYKGLKEAEQQLQKSIQSETGQTDEELLTRLTWVVQQKKQIEKQMPFLLSKKEIVELWFKIEKCKQEQQMIQKLIDVGL